MKKKLLMLLTAAALLLSLMAGCSGNTNPTQQPSSPPATTAPPSAAPSEAPTTAPTPEAPSTIMFTDSAGREVELPANITKISPSGALAQMFILAIAPDLLITTASEYPAEMLQYIPENVSALPIVGQFYGSDDLNFESIAAIGPEVVIDIGEPKKTIVEDMDSITENLAIPAIHITAALDSSPEAFRTLGKILNREEEGEALAQYCEKVLSQTADIMARFGENKKTALYCLGDAGLNVLAATSFHSEILDYVTDNLAVVDKPSSRGSGNETDMEQLLLWNPEILLFAPESIYSTVSSDAAWQQMQAVQSGAYYEVPNGPYNWMGSPPSINRYLGMQWLTKILYPEYAEFDLYETVSEYYSLFYHHDLTQAEYDALTQNSLAAVS